MGNMKVQPVTAPGAQSRQKALEKDVNSLDVINYRLEKNADFFSQEEQLKKLQDQYEKMSGGGSVEKVNTKKLTKQVSNSNSTPDFQMMAFGQP
jgi:hypothetical protein